MREPAKTFEDLLVWQKAHLFVLAVYRLSGTFPKYEIYGLTSQFRRAAVSIFPKQNFFCKKSVNCWKHILRAF